MMRVLITGTSSGIGLATARLFLDRDAEVVGLDLKECPTLADRKSYRHYVVDVCEGKGFLTAVNRFCTGQAIVIDGGEKDCNSTFVWMSGDEDAP